MKCLIYILRAYHVYRIQEFACILLCSNEFQIFHSIHTNLLHSTNKLPIANYFETRKLGN
jgi:hypothetical protein